MAEKCKTGDGKDATCISLPERFVGDAYDRTLTEPYVPGTDLRVRGIYGDINLVAGEPGEVSVRVRPFAYGTKSSQAEAQTKMQDALHVALDTQAGVVFIESTRDDAELPLIGTDLDVYLPPEFDGAIVAENRGNGQWNPGNVKVNFVGAAPSVEVLAASLSDCFVAAGPSVLYTAVRCDGDIRVIGANDDVKLETQGQLGTISLELATVFPSSGGGTLKAGSDIDVLFPADSSFSVQAVAESSVDFEGLPTGVCAVQSAAANSKSATCGDGGPLYQLTSTGGRVTASL